MNEVAPRDPPGKGASTASDWLPTAGELDGGTSLFEPEELADWLADRVRQRAPTAAVRFGDGEARLLLLDPEDRAATDVAREMVADETGLSLSSADLLELRALMTVAFNGADVLGIRFVPWSLSEQRTWMEKLAAHYAGQVAAGAPPAPLASCLFGHEIVGVLPGLLTGRRVSVVSCRELKPTLEDRWGAKDVVAYQVPSQRRVRDVDGPYEAAMHETAIWPDVHSRLRKELRVRERGEVFLVGAGFFGKDLCVRIREQGGVAIDMGSALDGMAGKLTRGPGRRILEHHATGMPMSKIDAHLRRLYGRSLDEDTLSRIGERVFEDFRETIRGDLERWQERPRESSHATVHLEPLEITLASGKGTCLVAVGHGGGRWEPLGIWWSADGEDRGPAIVADLRRRAAIDLTRLRPATAKSEELAPVREAIEAHGPFDDEEAARILVYLAVTRAAADQAGRRLSPTGS